MITLVIVTKPAHVLELQWCLASYCAHARSEFRILLLTESQNVRELKRRLINPPLPYHCVTVEAMAPEAESIAEGYLRQMAAKLLISKHTDCPRIVITDDDTEALRPWDASTFFAGESARIFFEADPFHFWSAGTRAVFRSRLPAHRFQLRLPFAIHGQTLAALAQSEPGKRALGAWHERQLVSEFEIMGEFALREDNPRRNVLIDARRFRTHWTIGADTQPAFRDWQGSRREFRKSIHHRLHAVPPLTPALREPCPLS